MSHLKVFCPIRRKNNLFLNCIHNLYEYSFNNMFTIYFLFLVLGCKIKALRAKTNTYIKTPVRGEEPVFVVTGRKEDVNKAKREILSAADHFSLIRASRKPSVDGSNAMFSGTSINPGTLGGIVARTQSGPPCLPGQITIQVRVPYRVVGLVVGPKGATIKHIQQETQTYIVTPSREKEPIFEVTGMPDNVETARKQIEAHIALRTGNSGQSSENGTESIGSSEFAHNLYTINTLKRSSIMSTGYFWSIEIIDIGPIVILPCEINRQPTKSLKNLNAYSDDSTKCNVKSYANSTKITFHDCPNSITNINTHSNSCANTITNGIDSIINNKPKFRY